MKNFKINIIYLSELNDSWRFDLLAAGAGAIHADDLDEAAFFHAMGGLELISDRHYIFFQSTDYLDLLEIIIFLLDSLSNLECIDDEIYQGRDFGHNIIARLVNTSGSTLYLKKLDNDSLTLSYVNQNENKIMGRNDFFFDNITLHEQDWINECKQGLDDYFKIVDYILTKHPNNSNGDFLRNISQRWRSFSG